MIRDPYDEPRFGDVFHWFAHREDWFVMYLGPSTVPDYGHCWQGLDLWTGNASRGQAQHPISRSEMAAGAGWTFVTTFDPESKFLRVR